MNEHFNLNKTPTTTKPSAQRYNTLMLFTILIILLFAFAHLYRYGIHIDIKIPSSDTIVVKKEIPQEVMETVNKVKERLTKLNEDPTTTMQQVYYYGKFILGFAVIVGVAYLCYKYNMSADATTTTKPPKSDT